MSVESIPNQTTDPTPEIPFEVAHIVRELEKTGDLLTPDFKNYQDHIDRIAPVRSILIITKAPDGFPPEWVRESWKGIFLPVRTDITRDGVEIVAREAIEALANTRPEAYEWWQNYWAQEGEKMSMEPPSLFGEFKEWSSNLQSLTFPIECGTIASENSKKD